LHRSGLMSICFAGCLPLGPRKNDLTIYWALGPFVRSSTLLVDPGISIPHRPGRVVDGRGLVGHVSRTWGHACGAQFMVVWWLILEKPPSAMDGEFSIEFGLKTRCSWFQRKLEVVRGVITKGASRRSNFVWSM
jgi:hypothetical protein